MLLLPCPFHPILCIQARAHVRLFDILCVYDPGFGVPLSCLYHVKFPAPSGYTVIFSIRTCDVTLSDLGLMHARRRLGVGPRFGATRVLLQHENVSEVRAVQARPKGDSRSVYTEMNNCATIVVSLFELRAGLSILCSLRLKSLSQV